MTSVGSFVVWVRRPLPPHPNIHGRNAQSLGCAANRQRTLPPNNPLMFLANPGRSKLTSFFVQINQFHLALGRILIGNFTWVLRRNHRPNHYNVKEAIASPQRHLEMPDPLCVAPACLPALIWSIEYVVSCFCNQVFPGRYITTLFRAGSHADQLRRISRGSHSKS